MANLTYMDIAVPNHWKGPQTGWSYLPSSAPIWPFPWQYHAELQGGWAGGGAAWEIVQDMWMAFAFAVLWFIARTVSKSFLFPPVARLMGMNPKKQRVIGKFSYNMWLLMFYGSSTLVGYFYVLRGEPYLGLPADAQSSEAMYNYYPYPTQPKLQLYYMYQLGFYLAELWAIFVEPKRSDFVEYLIHHVVSIALLSLSYIAREHRGGANVILLNDIPDVFLCAGKMFLYTGVQAGGNACFFLFTTTFAFFRLYCSPLITYNMIYLVPQFHPATTSYWVLIFMNGFVLLALHIFWFFLIIKLLIKLIVKGAASDPRSDDDEDEAGTIAKKAASAAKKAAHQSQQQTPSSKRD